MSFVRRRHVYYGVIILSLLGGGLYYTTNNIISMTTENLIEQQKEKAVISTLTMTESASNTTIITNTTNNNTFSDYLSPPAAAAINIRENNDDNENVHANMTATSVTNISSLSFAQSQPQQQQQQHDNHHNTTTDTDTDTTTTNNNNTNTTLPTTPTTITLLVGLSGEFGNHLQKIIHGWGVAKLLYDEYQIQSHIVYQLQARVKKKGKKKNYQVLGKARTTVKELKQCFLHPNFQQIDFDLGNDLYYKHEDNHPYFHELGDELNFITSRKENRYHTFTDVRTMAQHVATALASSLGAMAKTTMTMTTTPVRYEQDTRYNGTAWMFGASSSPARSIPQPMIKVASLQEIIFMDQYYQDLASTFVFNDEACCGGPENVPDDDESVFHYRNFATEMKASRRQNLGFEELPPKRISNELFGHLHAGDKLAIVGRNLHKHLIDNTTAVYQLVHELRSRNVTVRFTNPKNTGVEDFCFLTRTKKELVGVYHSSFVKMAAYLGGPTIQVTRLYQYGINGQHITQILQTYGNLTNPELSQRIQFETYR